MQSTMREKKLWSIDVAASELPAQLSYLPWDKGEYGRYTAARDEGQSEMPIYIDVS